MTKGVFTCTPEDTRDRAAGIFREHDCDCAPVVDQDRKVVGIITDRDVCISAYTQGRPLREIPVSTAMSNQVQCCKPDDALAATEGLLTTNQIRRLPVIDNDGRIDGILSLNDIASEAARQPSKRSKEVSDSEIGETPSAVCRRRVVQELVAAS